ncbi:MAG: flagellar assembly protein T N-terminal domain-containing protein [Rheinheimera sp.]|nr:flagellar assembly protein T N-terminal domain-containing protein [Rheinheimera sp.]
MRKLSLVTLALWATTSQAQWVEASGQATINGGDLVAARAQATEDAVRRALLFAGVSVRSVQEATDGLLTRESLQVQSYGEMQASSAGF